MCFQKLPSTGQLRHVVSLHGFEVKLVCWNFRFMRNFSALVSLFLFFFFFYPSPCLMRNARSYFPYQGLNPHPMEWKPGVLTTGSPGKSPLLLYFKTACGVAKDLDFEAWQPVLKFQLCCFPTVWPWASFLTSLDGQFLPFSKGMVIVTIS